MTREGTHPCGRGIDNPLDGRSLEQIESDVTDFHATAAGLKPLVDVGVLIKGAKLAKDFNAIRTIAVSEVEKKILEEEEHSNLHGLRDVIRQMSEGMDAMILATACAAVALFGTKASVAPIFAAEAAMEKSRGRILMLGIMLGFLIALLAPKSWEVQLGAALIPSLAIILVVMLCPESPRLLIRSDRYGEAYKSLRRLRRLEIQAARDLYLIHVQLLQEVRMYVKESNEQILESSFPYQKFVKKKSSFMRMLYLFTSKRNSRACLVAFLVMMSQQLCGINVLTYYSSTVFGNAAPLNQINFLNFGFGASNFVFTLPAFFLIDFKGRRFILLTSFFFMTITLLGASFCFNIEAEVERVAAVVVTVIVLYTASYSIGAGPVPFTLSAEIFPLAFREVGMSFSVMVNFLGLGLLVLFAPRITRGWSPDADNERIGQRNLLLLFTGLNVLMLFLLFLIIPSTEQKTLEDMNDLFDKPTMDRVSVNIRKAVELLKFIKKNDTQFTDSDPQMQNLQQANQRGLRRDVRRATL
ncbi:hypothetical protein BDV19DRAFT_376638 [Aspergillus venezuelensis]